MEMKEIVQTDEWISSNFQKESVELIIKKYYKTLYLRMSDCMYVFIYPPIYPTIALSAIIILYIKSLVFWNIME